MNSKTYIPRQTLVSIAKCCPWLFVLFSILLSSCSQGDDGVGEAPARPLVLTVDVMPQQTEELTRSGDTTRATIDDAAMMDGKTISVWAFQQGGTLMSGKSVSVGGGEGDTGVLWPEGGGAMRFYAVCPTTTTVSGAAWDAHPVISFSYDSDRDKDVMYASSIDQKSGGRPSNNVALTFSHVLTAVQFRKGTDIDGDITSVTISGVKKDGTFQGGTWTSVTGEGDVVFPAECISNGGDYGTGVVYLPPQQLTDCTIKVSTTTKTYRGTISATWAAGHIVKYTLNKN